jgi:HSP20 family protein
MVQRSLLPTLFGQNGKPFTDVINDLQNQIENVFDGFSTGRGLAWAAPDSNFMPAIDVSETGDAIELLAELPGVDPKDVEINLTGQTLTIRGEKKSEKENKGKRWYMMERSYGAFMRSFNLPFMADPAKVEASYDKGQLKVHVPKPPEMKRETAKITIKSTN